MTRRGRLFSIAIGAPLLAMTALIVVTSLIESTSPIKVVDAALTSGTSVHTHAGTTTGGSTLTTTVLNTPTLNTPTLNSASLKDTTKIFDPLNSAYYMLLEPPKAAVLYNEMFVGAVTPAGTNHIRFRSVGTNDHDLALAAEPDGRTFTLMTGDGADNGEINLCAGGPVNCGTDRGAAMTLRGNEYPSDPGMFYINSGNNVGSRVVINAGTSVVRLERNSGLTIVNNGNATNTDSRIVSTAACATGYTRVGVNYCRKTSFSSGDETNLVRDTCTAFATPSANAIRVLFRVSASAIAIGSPVVALRETTVFTFPTSACTAGVWASAVSASSTQRLADADAVVVARQQQELFSAAVSSGNYYIQFLDDTGNNGNASALIIGYYD